MRVLRLIKDRGVGFFFGGNAADIKEGGGGEGRLKVSQAVVSAA